VQALNIPSSWGRVAPDAKEAKQKEAIRKKKKKKKQWLLILALADNFMSKRLNKAYN